MKASDPHNTMQTLLKEAKHASFVHFGEDSPLLFFDDWLKNTNYPNPIKKRIAFVFTEIAQNQRKHSIDKQKNIIWILEKKSELEIFSFNPVNEGQKQNITEEFTSHLQQSEEAIKKENRKRIMNGEKGTGFIQIKLKSSAEPIISFSEHKNQINFLLKTSIYVHS